MSDDTSKTRRLIKGLRDVIDIGGDPRLRAALLADVDAWLAAHAAPSRANAAPEPYRGILATLTSGMPAEEDGA